MLNTFPTSSHPHSFLERVFHHSVSTSSRLMTNALRLFMAMVMAGHRFARNHGFGRAAELAYGTLFALVPVSALTLMVLTRVSLSPEEVQEFLFRHLLPSSSSIVTDYLNQFANRAGAIGVISSIFLAVTAISLLYNIESAINDIWEIEKRRSFWVKVAAYWSLLTLGPILLLGSFYLTTELKTYVFSGLLGIGVLRQTVTYGLSLVFIWIACFLLYTQLPNTRVRFTAGLVGAVIAGTLWHVAKFGFDWYVTQAVAYNRIYGPLSVIPLFLLWLYVIWLIVLWGTELTYSWQNLPMLKGRLSVDRLSRWDHVDVAIRILICCARHFMGGKGKITAAAIVNDTRLDLRHIQRIVGTLERGGMLYYMDDAERSYVLARPPDTIALSEIFTLFDDTSKLADAEDMVDVYMTSLGETVHGAIREKLEDMTLQTILDALEDESSLPLESIDLLSKKLP